MHPIPESPAKPVPGLQPDETPIAWASEPDHIFNQVGTDAGLTIYKIDLNSGRRELWQRLQPKDPVGLRPMSSRPTAITPDGRWMVYT